MSLFDILLAVRTTKINQILNGRIQDKAPAEKEHTRLNIVDNSRTIVQGANELILISDIIREQNGINGYIQRVYGPGTILLGMWDFHTGELLRPLNGLYTQLIPTIKIYDGNGELISEEEPIQPYNSNIWAGQTPRLWL